MDTQTNPYMLRVLTQGDPIVRKAQERILIAAREALRAKEQLHFALKDLERHPDFIKTERAKRKGKPLGASLTPAWWLHNGIRSVLEDAILEDAADWLFEDSNPRRLASSLRVFAETEKRDLKRFARRRPAARKAVPLTVVKPVAVAA